MQVSCISEQHFTLYFIAPETVKAFCTLLFVEGNLVSSDRKFWEIVHNFSETSSTPEDQRPEPKKLGLRARARMLLLLVFCFVLFINFVNMHLPLLGFALLPLLGFAYWKWRAPLSQNQNEEPYAFWFSWGIIRKTLFVGAVSMFMYVNFLL